MKATFKTLTLAALGLFTFSACEKEVEIEKIVEVEKEVYINQNFDPNKGVAKLSFSHFVGDQPFEIKKNFTDAAGNTYKFDEIRYWVSNVEFVKANGEAVKVPESYYLVENRDTLFYYGTTAANLSAMKSNPRAREEVLVGNVTPGEYKKIRFAIGVDPEYNTNFTLKSGELDINQMSQVAGWAWHTSYIFLRVKGIFLAKGGDALTDAKKFIVETGGNDQYRTVELELPTAISVEAGKTNQLALNVDLLGILGGSLPKVPAYTGSKPAGWAADPNLSPYEKFINASVSEDMKKLADNSKSSIKLAQ